MRALLLVAAVGGPCLLVQAQSVVRGEYWIDQDPGWSLGTSFALNADNDTAGVVLTPSTNGYAPGVHTLGIRTVDDDGNWSLTNFTPLVVIAPPESPDVVRVEYFLNNDPGFATASTGWTGSTADLQAHVFTPDLSDAQTGQNTLLLRTYDASGHWSLTNHIAVNVIPTPEQGVIDAAETFALRDKDPGFGAADPHAFSVPDDQLVDSVFNAPVPVQYLLGDTLMIRTHDSRGNWSLTNHVATDFSTSTAELEDRTGINVGPNPFRDQVTIDPHGNTVRVFIYDPLGQLVCDRMVRTRTVLDLGARASGTYQAFFWGTDALLHRLSLVKAP